MGSFLAALPGFVWRYFSSSAVFHVVNASPSYADPVRGRPSSSAVLSREVNMLTIATAALLVLAATAEAAAIQYNPESRDTHVSDGPSFEHKRGFYYTDLHGKKIKDVSSWAPSWSSYRDAHPAEPSHSREPSMMSKPAYKDYNAPQAAIKDNGQYGTVKKKHTSPKTAQTTKPTTSTRQEPAVRYARSSPTFAQSYRLRRQRSSGDGDETLKRLADALALVTHSLLSGEHLHHPMSAEKPAQEQEEPEAVVEDEPEGLADDEEVDPKNEELDSDDGEVDSDDDEVDTKDDDDEEDTEDPEEDAKKPKKKSKKSKKKSKKQKKSRKSKKKSRKMNEEPEDSDMDDMDSDMDYYGHDGYADYAPAPRFRSPAYRRYKKRSVGMDNYGYDGYPAYAHKRPSRKSRPSRKPRPSYMQPLEHHRRYRRSAGLSRSQLKKYRMSQEARFRRMQSAAGQKRRRKNKHMRAKKYYYM